MRGSNLLLDRGLGSDALFDGRRGPAAGRQTHAPSGSRTCNTDDVCEVFGGIGLEEKWDDDDSSATISHAQLFDLCHPELTNSGMKNTFKLFTLRGVVENNFGDFTAAQLPCPIDHARA